MDGIAIRVFSFSILPVIIAAKVKEPAGEPHVPGRYTAGHDRAGSQVVKVAP